MQREWVLTSLCLSFMLVACQDLGPESLEGPEAITEDHSGIADPRARWQAYHLSSYVFEQQRTCFCVNGGAICMVYVSNDRIIDVVRKSDGQSMFSDFGSLYRTANQLLTMADSLKRTSVAGLVIDYDERFGFPKYLYVDPSAQMADEEYGYVTTSIRKLLK